MDRFVGADQHRRLYALDRGAVILLLRKKKSGVSLTSATNDKFNDKVMVNNKQQSIIKQPI